MLPARTVDRVRVDDLVEATSMCLRDLMHGHIVRVSWNISPEAMNTADIRVLSFLEHLADLHPGGGIAFFEHGAKNGRLHAHGFVFTDLAPEGVDRLWRDAKVSRVREASRYQRLFAPEHHTRIGKMIRYATKCSGQSNASLVPRTIASGGIARVWATIVARSGSDRARERLGAFVAEWRPDPCRWCGGPCAPERKMCSPACRQAAYRARQGMRSCREEPSRSSGEMLPDAVVGWLLKHPTIIELEQRVRGMLATGIGRDEAWDQAVSEMEHRLPKRSRLPEFREGLSLADFLRTPVLVRLGH